MICEAALKTSQAGYSESTHCQKTCLESWFVNQSIFYLGWYGAYFIQQQKTHFLIDLIKHQGTNRKKCCLQGGIKCLPSNGFNLQICKMCSVVELWLKFPVSYLFETVDSQVWLKILAELMLE